MKVRLDPDAIDLEQLKETLNSPGYRTLTARLGQTYAAELKKLATVASWDETRFQQGFLQGLECAARLPEIVQGEIKQRLERNKRNAVETE